MPVVCVTACCEWERLPLCVNNWLIFFRGVETTNQDMSLGGPELLVERHNFERRFWSVPVVNAPCIEYLPTVTLKVTQFCRYIYQHHGSIPYNNIYTRYWWHRNQRKALFFWVPISWVKCCFCTLEAPNSYLMSTRSHLKETCVKFLHSNVLSFLRL